MVWMLCDLNMHDDVSSLQHWVYYCVGTMVAITRWCLPKAEDRSAFRYISTFTTTNITLGTSATNKQVKTAESIRTNILYLVGERALLLILGALSGYDTIQYSVFTFRITNQLKRQKPWLKATYSMQKKEYNARKHVRELWESWTAEVIICMHNNIRSIDNTTVYTTPPQTLLPHTLMKPEANWTCS